MKKICFISSRYPTEVTPTTHVFVQQLVWSLADLGIECTVISPVPINKNKELFALPLKKSEYTTQGSRIDVYFPRYVSFGQNKMGKLKLSKFTLDNFYKATYKVFKTLEEPQVVYGHFLNPAGITAARIAKRCNVISLAAFGESTPWSIDNIGVQNMRKELKSLDGIISVSSNNKKVLESLNLIAPDKITVIPNAIRSEHFYPRDQLKARKRFGLSESDFVVVFVGQFTDRKGIMRLSEATDGLEGIVTIYGGKGELEPTNKNSKFCGSVIPQNMPWFYSAGDVFVLPTLNEGCCNAIIEAMACGLPIISSNLPFNYDILDKSNSILIDPMDITSIQKAILLLKNNIEIKRKLMIGSLNKAKQLSYEQRATRVIEWVDQLIKERSISSTHKLEA